jgi:hypothetical protein
MMEQDLPGRSDHHPHVGGFPCHIASRPSDLQFQIAQGLCSEPATMPGAVQGVSQRQHGQLEIGIQLIERQIQEYRNPHRPPVRRRPVFGYPAGSAIAAGSDFARGLKPHQGGAHHIMGNPAFPRQYPDSRQFPHPLPGPENLPQMRDGLAGQPNALHVFHAANLSNFPTGCKSFFSGGRGNPA